MRRARRLFVSILTFLIASQTPLYAQTRSGTWLNVGAGWGSMTCSQCDGSHGGFSGQIGGGMTLSSNLRIGIGSNVWISSVERTSASVTTIGTEMIGTLSPVARIYPSASTGFFMVAGGGLALRVWSGGDIGVAGVIGAGYDIRTSGASVSPFANLIVTRVENVSPRFFQAGIGLTFH